MNKSNRIKLGIMLAGVLGLIGESAKADIFGSGANAFTIDFVNIGNPGNADDAGAGGGSYSSPYGGVSYTYRMGTYEISQAQIEKATASGLANVTAGAWSGNQPAANMTWFEMAAFVNWMNTSTGHQAAYNLSQIPPDFAGNTWSLTLWSSAQAWQLGGENLYRNKDAYYFLPSGDEWYKSAYHKNDGVTANYWDYATGSNDVPTPVTNGTTSGTAVFYDGVTALAAPADVNNDGGLSSYGTMGQDGNIWEWTESDSTAPNDNPVDFRDARGGNYAYNDVPLQSSFRGYNDPRSGDIIGLGFRVASIVPEPTTAVSLLLGLGVLALRRNRNHVGCCALGHEAAKQPCR